MTVFNKQDYLDALNQLIPDNSTQQISPLDIRTALTDLADSVPEFLNGVDIDTANMATPDIRTTRVGELALSKMDLAGHSSQDNSAFGYYALGGNYNGENNTAIGSHALSCNLYGDNNVAVGFNAIPANLTGSGNVGIGNYTLQLLRNGNFNIAIGNAAGYYVNPNDSYKFYLGSFVQDSDSLCSAVSGSGSPPLLFGDLQGLILGIGVKTLSAYGALQVNGNVVPSVDLTDDLGHPSARWNNVYATGIGNDGVALSFDSDESMVAYGSIVPSVDGTFKLGSPTKKWDAYINDLVVSGHATINNLTYNLISSCLYDCKTLHLATSGDCSQGLVDSTVCGYLTDEGIDGGGFEIHSSGVGYQRNYRFIYRFPDQTLTYLENDNLYSRSRWESNISIYVDDGRHVQTQRVLGNDRVSLVTQSGGGYGLFLRSNQATPSSSYAWLGSEDHLKSSYFYYSDVNIVGPSGNNNDFIVSTSSPNSGVRVGNRLMSRVSGNMMGFGNEYYDTNNPASDRYSLHVYNGQSNILEAFTVLRNVNPASGFFGITNIQHAPSAAPILPATVFNIQAATSMTARFSTISATSRSKLELLGNGNTKASGMQVYYDVAQDTLQGGGGSNNIVVGIDLIRANGTTGIESGVLSITEKGYVSVGRGVAGVDPFTVSHSQPSSGTIAMRAQASKPVTSSTFGKIYVKPVSLPGQTMSVFFLDDGGNESQVLRNQNNTMDGLVYGDSNGNTYAGWTSPASRPTAAAFNNTSLGYAAMSGMFNGSNNVAIGSGALQSSSFGRGNVVVGANSFNQVAGAVGNVILGPFNASNITTAPTNCIMIGSGLINSGTLADNSLFIGFNSQPLVAGSFSSRTLGVKNGKFYVDSVFGDQVWSVSTSLIGSRYTTFMDVKDNLNSDKTAGYMALRFLDMNNVARTLMAYDHAASAMTRVPTYNSPLTPRPFVELSGDMKLLGALRFSDGTSVETAGDISLYSGTGIVVSGGTVNLAFDTMDDIGHFAPVDVAQDYLAMSIFDGSAYKVGKVTLANLASYIGSGYGAVGQNCNHIFTDSTTNPLIDRTNNASDIFIGCSVGIGATGWKHSIMMGTEAGYGSTTPNVGLLTDTACTFIGLRAGREASNIQNCIFMGTQAGYLASSASVSIFIGSNAGQDSQFSNSVGIGQHALRGLPGSQTGVGNIEIVAGLLDNQRLMYNKQVSNKLNINNTIAGDTALRRASAGDANLTPDAVFTVYKNSSISGHASTPFVQSWFCDNTRVAAINCDGDQTGGDGTPITIEGNMRDAIARPTLSSAPTSGVMIRHDANWNTLNTVYIVNRDTTLSIQAGSYVVATRINGTYRPIATACSGV